MDDYYNSLELDKQKKTRIRYDHGRCQNCGSTNNLQVHHLRYNNYYKEDVKNDLKVLCKDCHQKIHDLKIRRRSVICD